LLVVVGVDEYFGRSDRFLEIKWVEWKMGIKLVFLCKLSHRRRHWTECSEMECCMWGEGWSYMYWMIDGWDLQVPMEEKVPVKMLTLQRSSQYLQEVRKIAKLGWTVCVPLGWVHAYIVERRNNRYVGSSMCRRSVTNIFWGVICPGLQCIWHVLEL
jgi:hypothetical protein